RTLWYARPSQLFGFPRTNGPVPGVRDKPARKRHMRITSAIDGLVCGMVGSAIVALEVRTASVKPRIPIYRGVAIRLLMPARKHRQVAVPAHRWDRHPTADG